MKLSIFCPFGLKTPIRYSRPQNWGFGGISPPKWEAISTKPQKCTSAGRNGSKGFLYVLGRDKSRGNKKFDKEEEEEEEEEELRHIFALFGIAVKWQ